MLSTVNRNVHDKNRLKRVTCIVFRYNLPQDSNDKDS